MQTIILKAPDFVGINLKILLILIIISREIPIIEKMAALNPKHFIRTAGGVDMPRIIYGTAWKKERTCQLVIDAILSGFKGIDTACQPKHYFEPGVGEALKKLSTEHGIPREALFIQTKFTSLSGQDPNNIPYDKNASIPDQVKQSLAMSLKNLGTTYLDSLVLHGPLSTFDKTMQVWRTFETFVDEGSVKQLGISNLYDVAMLIKLYEEARIKPSVIQNRFYADTGYDKEIRSFAKKNNIFYQSFWTLSANPKVLRDPNVLKMSQKRGKTPEVLLFTYLIQSGGFAPLTGTTSKTHMREDLEAMDTKLEEEEMKIFDNFFN